MSLVDEHVPEDGGHHLSVLELTRKVDELHGQIRRIREGMAALGDELLPKAISELADMKAIAEAAAAARRAHEKLVLERLNDLDRRLTELEHVVERTPATWVKDG